jgi:hypothetical protein
MSKLDTSGKLQPVQSYLPETADSLTIEPPRTTLLFGSSCHRKYPTDVFRFVMFWLLFSDGDVSRATSFLLPDVQSTT